MEKESSNRTPWIIVLVLTIILFGGLMLTQPMNEEEAIELAKELVPAEFDEVLSTKFIPIKENDLGAELWEVQLINSKNEKVILIINGQSEKLIEGRIEDGETGEVLKEL